jgi:N6-adenosine-specific RNA methylase IME4
VPSKQPDPTTQFRSPKELRLHRQAALVPSMTTPEAVALRVDIERRGIADPLAITKDGVVLDGRHRLQIALELGLDYVPVRIVEPDDEVDYMLSAALQRRQLSPSQRAALVLILADYLATKAAALARKNANLRKGTAEVARVPHRGGRSRDHAANLAGVSPRLVQDAIRVKETDRELFEQVTTGRLPIRQAVQQLKREERYSRIGPSPALPAGVFDLIYADPPWHMGSPGSSSSPEQHYPTMTTAAIAALNIPAADNAVLLLWAVSGMLPDALDVIAGWGFVPKTTLVWVKPSIGPGNYARNRHEILIVATRGTYPLPEPKDRPDSVVDAPRGRHSEKPKVFYELIERMYPTTTRLEMFARGKPHPGWTAWGNEVTE